MPILEDDDVFSSVELHVNITYEPKSKICF